MADKTWRRVQIKPIAWGLWWWSGLLDCLKLLQADSSSTALLSTTSMASWWRAPFNQRPSIDSPSAVATFGSNQSLVQHFGLQRRIWEKNDSVSLGCTLCFGAHDLCVFSACVAHSNVKMTRYQKSPISKNLLSFLIADWPEYCLLLSPCSS